MPGVCRGSGDGELFGSCQETELYTIRSQSAGNGTGTGSGIFAADPEPEGREADVRWSADDAARAGISHAGGPDLSDGGRDQRCAGGDH